MDALETLREQYAAYVKEEADKVVNFMVERNLTQDWDHSCDAPNWDQKRHRAMPDIIAELRRRGINTTSSVNWGVTDYVYIINLNQ